LEEYSVERYRDPKRRRCQIEGCQNEVSFVLRREIGMRLLKLSKDSDESKEEEKRKGNEN
jgi:hypothetical protein